MKFSALEFVAGLLTGSVVVGFLKGFIAFSFIEAWIAWIVFAGGIAFFSGFLFACGMFLVIYAIDYKEVV